VVRTSPGQVAPCAHQRADEHHVNATFTKLGLSEERKLSRRVATVLTYLRDNAESFVDKVKSPARPA
jgi:hypothetical protein